MQNETSKPDAEVEKQAEQILRAQGLTADVQPKGLDHSYRRIIIVAGIFVVFVPSDNSSYLCSQTLSNFLRWQKIV